MTAVEQLRHRKVETAVIEINAEHADVFPVELYG